MREGALNIWYCKQLWPKMFCPNPKQGFHLEPKCINLKKDFNFSLKILLLQEFAPPPKKIHPKFDRAQKKKQTNKQTKKQKTPFSWKFLILKPSYNAVNLDTGQHRSKKREKKNKMPLFLCCGYGCLQRYIFQCSPTNPPPYLPPPLPINDKQRQIPEEDTQNTGGIDAEIQASPC